MPSENMRKEHISQKYALKYNSFRKYMFGKYILRKTPFRKYAFLKLAFATTSPKVAKPCFRFFDQPDAKLSHVTESNKCNSGNKQTTKQQTNKLAQCNYLKLFSDVRPYLRPQTSPDIIEFEAEKESWMRSHLFLFSQLTE